MGPANDRIQRPAERRVYCIDSFGQVRENRSLATLGAYVMNPPVSIASHVPSD